MKSDKPITVAVLISLGVAGLAGCAPPAEFKAQVKMATETITELHKFAPPLGYRLGKPRGGEYGLDYQNAQMTFSGESKSTRSLASECSSVLTYADRLGTFSATANRASAQIACVNTINYIPEIQGTIASFPEVGSPVFGLGGVSLVNGKSRPIYLSMNRAVKRPVTAKSAYTYNLNIGTGGSGSGMGTGECDPICWAYAAALDAVGQYRKMHPQADPYSPSAINIALKSFKAEHPTIRVENIPNKKGDITVIHLTPKKDRKIATLPVYVSIKAFDPTYFGVPDPGSGYTLGYVDTLKETTAFGQAKVGHYPKH